jgi:hypothetical protein
MVEKDSKAKTGVSGLDDILLGGLSRGKVFLLEASPGRPGQQRGAPPSPSSNAARTRASSELSLERALATPDRP